MKGRQDRLDPLEVGGAGVDAQLRNLQQTHQK
jgi:hypothetical protein